ncbi:MAG: sugar phosphate nucleotidyltransferase [Myxococcota bacterium]|jgi:glucose-1-phosphate adenylyltransferase
MRQAGDTVVMLLAGGVGSRLSVLANRRAKPAVPFGGAYRIIDFTLSNVMHSGLERVGLLTQYKPFSLMDHVRGGEPWDLIGHGRGIKVLPPHTGEEESDWYKGTADAIYQNLAFLGDYNPDKVLILSGDHIYRMDYERMIAAHERCGADLTIAAMTVPWEETHRFGVMMVDGDSMITGFQEKSKNASSNLASMGIYVFSYKALVEELRSVVGTRKGFDFGKDIIPGMLGRCRLQCYRFEGYWRDVGTIQSYHEANMDCLDPASGLDLHDWKIRTVPDYRGLGDRLPVRSGPKALVHNSLVATGCVIDGEVSDSILFPGVRVGRGARVTRSIIMQDTVVGDRASVDYSIIDKGCFVGAGSMVGVGDPSIPNRMFPTHLDSGISVIGKSVSIPQDSLIGRNCTIYPGAMLIKAMNSTLPDGETVAS